MQPVKVGIIGCGLAAANLHWPAYQKMPDLFEVAIVCDSVGQRAREFASLVGNVPYVGDFRDVFQRSDVEAVDIVLPIHLHYPVTERALQAGKHVFLEKPLAADLKEARRMLDLDKRHPQVKMVGENFRYRRALARLKSHLDGGTIGRPYAAFCNLLAPFYLADYARTPWRREPGFLGGVLTDVGIHYAAQLRLLFGELAAESAFAQGVNPDLGKLDSMCFLFSSAGGLRGVMNLFLGVKDYFTEGILILGTEGSISGGQSGANFGDFKITVHKAGGTQEEVIEADTGVREEFLDFYQAIRTGSKVQSSFAEAFQDLKLILDAVRLAERKR
jgi:predicted dehydrogenase